jgi:hypothetical protein
VAGSVAQQRSTPPLGALWGSSSSSGGLRCSSRVQRERVCLTLLHKQQLQQQLAVVARAGDVLVTRTQFKFC